MRKRRTRGKILKVRLGYNANSSALAAAISWLLLGSAAAVVVLNMVGSVLFSREIEPVPSDEPSE